MSYNIVNKKSFYLFVLLAISLAILLSKYKIETASSLNKCRSHNEYLSNGFNELYRYNMLQSHYNGMKIDAGNSIYDSLMVSLAKGPVLVFSFNEFSCEACVDYIIDWIDEVAKRIDTNRILFLVMYENEHEASFINRRLKERYAFLSFSSDKELSLDEGFKYIPPCVFILNPDLLISNLFIYSIIFPELNEEYIKDVEHNFDLGY